MPLISVIVPVYKVEDYLSACVNSILNQSYKNLEIILVNDGSLDSSGRTCDMYAEKDSRVVVLHQENKGTSAARNAGLEICKGAYISFVDSDDIIHPEFIERLYNNLGDSDIVMCNYVQFYNEAELDAIKLKEAPIKRMSGHEMLIRREYYSPPVIILSVNKLYKKELWQNIRFPEENITEDIFVCHHIIGEAKCVSFFNEHLYFYRQIKTSKTKREDILIKRKEHELKANQDRLIYAQKKQNKALEKIAIFNILQLCFSTIEEVDPQHLPVVFEKTIKTLIKKATLRQKVKWFLIKHMYLVLTIFRVLKRTFQKKVKPAPSF